MKAKKRKKLLLPVTAVVLPAALGVGIWFGTRGSGEPVNVYPFQYIGMTEFWGDAQESYGPVTTDKIQTEFLSDTQTVTEVRVKDGDMVKKGDVLFAFDTTLDALSLERKRLDVEKIKVQIKAAEERLEDTRKLVPYTPPGETEPEEETADLGEQLTDQLFQVSENAVYDGKTQETALICWIRNDATISDAILEVLYETSLQYRQENAEEGAEATEPADDRETSSASDEPETSRLESEEEEKQTIPALYLFNGEDRVRGHVHVGKDPYKIVDAYTHGGKTYWLKSAKRISDSLDLQEAGLMIDAYPQSGKEEQKLWKDAWEEGIAVEYVREVSFLAERKENDELVSVDKDAVIAVEVGDGIDMEITAEIKDFSKEYQLAYKVTSPENGILKILKEDESLRLAGTADQLISAPESYTVSAVYTFTDNYDQTRAVEETFTFSISVLPKDKSAKDDFYVVFKSTQDDYLKGTQTVWQGAKITAYEDGTFGMSLYNASGFADHTLPEEENVEIEIDLPEIEPNAMYTAEEILNMQKECYAAIKEQNEALKMAETEYAIMERELGDGNIYAEIDGKVVSLLTEEEARENQQPLLKVSGGGGFYIEGSVSELEKDKLKIGQEVTVNDWSSGGMYTGEVVSISDFPSDSDNWNGMGNPTASYYPFKAFVGEDADLQAGSYVSVSYSTASAEQGIYLEKPFVRTENGNSYIFVRGADGRLEKRNVKVGKLLWGSYYEILSPLGEEDYLAFPYGKNVKDGAPTVESDLSTLYGY